ncbi:MAG: hypothetical protein R3E75_13550 [Steroidobacteraceae bacterium]|nr:type II toxin-antitoxin system VapC family toxin [Nevskiaceae bacterium]MCP5340127.1 type II toxin-antitoxin system VapC family toxin [Nevskiaceae bacterium]MCP5472452.1 type II toxin-antitoxin system VapC family toxin [Nevskiaceae bacterium]
MFLCVVSVHEIEKGITLLEQKAATTKASALRNWLTGLTATFTDKVLSLDAETTVLSGRLEVQTLSGGTDPGMADAVIVGIAQTHGLTIVSRNATRFDPLGISADTRGSGSLTKAASSLIRPNPSS